MRLVDIDQLDNVVCRLNNEGWQITRGQYKLIRDVLDEFPEVRYWIPVVEKLPERGEESEGNKKD